MAKGLLNGGIRAGGQGVISGNRPQKNTSGICQDHSIGSLQMNCVIQHPASILGLYRNKIEPGPQIFTLKLKNEALVMAFFGMIREGVVSVSRHRSLHR